MVDHRYQSGITVSAELHAQQPVDLQRLAALIANTELPFPSDLAAGDARRLTENVRFEKRKRLIQFLARAIAHDIVRGAQPD